MKNKILSRGAEAIILKKGNLVIKNRIIKSYRFEQLDNKLRKQRTKKEAKLLQKLAPIIFVPKVINQSEYKLELEYINGKKLSEYLDTLKDANAVCIQIGQNLAKLHDYNIIHGDLTTSNMILKEKKVYFIDFGLGFESSKIEDKAVDLHLIKRALEAKHFKHYRSFFQKVLKGYKESKNAKEVIFRLERVESRGRYKEHY